MGWQDRHYNRDNGDADHNPLRWLLGGSIPLFTVFGIHVRAHASLVLCVIFILLLGMGNGFIWEDRLYGSTILFIVVLLHEFGHCFASRYVGGAGDEVVMTPLGGLAMVDAPKRWGAQLFTVAAGPAVNVLICLIAGTILWITVGHPSGFLFFHPINREFFGWFDPVRYAFWFFTTSYMLLLFNLLLIFPLDGGQMLRAILWWKIGYRRATLISCVVGMVGSVMMFAFGLATLGIFLALIAVSCFMVCYQMRLMTLAEGPEDWGADEVDYSAAYEQPRSNRRTKSVRSRRRAALRVRREEREAQLERDRIDAILAKVSATGMASLTWLERRALRKATEHQRKRDLEVTR